DALPTEIQSAKDRMTARRKAAEPLFQQWLQQATPESLADDFLVDGLIAYAPLSDPDKLGVRLLGDRSEAFTSTTMPEWQEDGPFGPAPKLSAKSVLSAETEQLLHREQPFTASVWFNAQGTQGSSSIVAQMDVDASHRGWDLYRQGGNLAIHLIDRWPENALKVRTKRSVVKAGKWQHFAVTYDGSGKAAGVTLYVDGKRQDTVLEKNSLKPNASFETSTPLVIGRRSKGAAFDGQVQDFRLFQRLIPKSLVTSLAKLPQIQAVLSLKASERKPPQTNQLRLHFLASHDLEYRETEQLVTRLESEQKRIRERSPITHIQTERSDQPAMAHILMRGEYDQKGDKVAAATPESMHPMTDSSPPNRLGLARWVVDPANPLTSRVIVNRFWQEVFGRGLVPTTEDFGVTGTLPSHPDLLDYLAVTFQESGWDVKQFYKLMLMSATYRQAALNTPEKQRLDRDNAMLSRGPRFRMDAEMVRDYALASCDLLSSEMGGPSVKPYQPSDIWNVVGLPGSDTRNYVQDKGDDLFRRTVYTFWKRMSPPPSLEALNAPSREVCTVRRERTNTPLQALVTLNDPQFLEAARRLAEVALRAGDGDDVVALDEVAKRLLSRSFKAMERQILMESLDEFYRHYTEHPEDALAVVSIGESPQAQELNPISVAAWTMVCNQVMNLDEVLNK
ncbi:MAG: DUF1553 domain-containing protein, partial [Planctomycetota bacterium]